MTRVIFFLPTKAINDATDYYVKLIERAFVEAGINVVYYDNDKFDIENSDFIFTIRVRDFIQIFKRRRTAKIIMWFQGLGPEEYLMINNYSIRAYTVSYLFNIVEKISIRKSFYNLFVSKRMQEYFKEKHSYNKNNYSIIPCYNKNLINEYFNASLKPKGTFVYAGSLYSWQCFDRTVALYKEIERKNDKTFLTVLTMDTVQAEELIKMHNIKNYKVFYVPLEDLDHELSKHKYGFILREDHIINQVATPTKMNSYLSVGLMPIYTNVVDSFNENLDLDIYEVKTTIHENLDQMSNRIIKHDNIVIDYDDFFETCEKNFSGYYDDRFNINKIKEELIEKVILKGV